MEKNQENKKTYKRILNNLFSFNYADSCIYTYTNKQTFDLNIFLSEEIIRQYILIKNTFSIKINNDLRVEKFINDLRKVENENNYLTIELLIEKHRIRIPKYVNRNVYDIIDYLFLKNENKSNNFWKKYQLQVLDSYEANNIWPLYIATGFIKFRIKSSVFYAPLILKEVCIDCLKSKNNILTFKLKSQNSNWQINEKLFFLFNEANICNLDIETINLKNLSAYQCIDIIKNLLNHEKKSFDFEILTKPFLKIKRNEIKNSIIEFCPGVLLGFFHVEGNVLRKKVQEIIKNNELESILNSELNKTKFYNAINKEILNNEKPIFKIQPLNYSQSKAVISSLKQNSIIWGPPGTGKSQTIANIIANIIAQKKTALVISQKKAALSILKKRLNDLSNYILFLIDENISKKQFYFKLQGFVESIFPKLDWLFSNYDLTKKLTPSQILDATTNEILSNNLKKYLDALMFLNNFELSKEDQEFILLFKILSLFPKLNKNDKNEILNLIVSLDNNFIYPIDFNFVEYDDKNNFASFLKKFAQLNNIKKEKKLFRKQNYPHKIIKKIFRIFKKYEKINNYLNLNLNNFKHLFNNEKYLKSESIFQIKIILNFDFNELIIKNYFVDDTYKILNHSRNWIATKIYNFKVDSFSYRYKRKSLDYRFTLFMKATASAWQRPKSFLAKYQDVITKIFPIIVSTPQSFMYSQLLKKNNFDYVIFDESSQIYPEIAIPFLHSAKIKIIAGDLNQMRPTNWFKFKHDYENEEIIDQSDIINESESLLDYGLNKGVFKIMLEKNYRFENSSLVDFSNTNFYKNKLNVINNLKKQTKLKANNIEIINVNGFRTYKYNKIEAKKVIETIKKYLIKYFKIIVLAFNTKQKEYIADYIFEYDVDLIKYIDEKRIVIKNLENIQGDEADLVIISIGYDKKTQFSRTYVCSYNGSNALNVAITRARQKMVVIKSFCYEDLEHINSNSNDFLIFKKWILYLDKKYEELKKINHNLESKTQNPILKNNFFENIVFELKNELKENKFLDFKIKTNLNVGYTNIPIYIEKNNKFILGFIFLNLEKILEVKTTDKKHYYNQFLKTIDFFNYLKNKKYNVKIINKIEWTFKKKILLKNIINFLTKFF